MEQARARKPRSGKKGKKGKKAPHRQGFVAASAPGCHVVHAGADGESAGWAGRAEPLVLADYGLERESDVPDLSLDPESGLLTAFNSAATRKSFYVSTPCVCVDHRGQRMQQAAYRDAQGLEGRTTTLVLSLAPRTTLDVCSLGGAEMFSHISDLGRPLSPRAEEGGRVVVDFVLGGEGPWLCSQGPGGGLSHFTRATRDAVDLECAEGTPVLAAGAGEVLEARDSASCSGSHAENLFHWNSVMLRLDEGNVVCEYVHIRAGSVRVRPGERVQAGQVLCESGAVGFCPVPHLHFQCHLSDATDAPTIPFAFRSAADSTVLFVPQVGRYYDANGITK